KAEMEEYKALEVFEQLATPLQWSTHLILKSKMKLYGTKSFPRNTEENDEQVDAESGYIEFKHYNELREKRLNLEAEQSIYF
ncbi:unnamed protein product, partial [Rotaria magnacalcarata]